MLKISQTTLSNYLHLCIIHKLIYFIKDGIIE